MPYTLTKHSTVDHKSKFGIELDVYSTSGDFGFVLVETESGHNEEFYNKKSTFQYIVLEGEGVFVLDDEEVPVKKGDSLLIQPMTRIYYKGKMKLALITNPAWKAENEIETKPTIW